MSSAHSSKLAIRLLGDLQILHEDLPVTDVVQPREQALLTWLLIHCDAPQPRHFLAFSFWPDSTEGQALTNLRKTLHLLRRHLPDADTYLQVDHQQLQWRADAPCVVDVIQFQEELAGAKLDESPTVVRQRLARAVNLYRGELLPGCYDEWIIPMRERLHQAYMDALDLLIDLLEETRNYMAATGYAQRALTHDPLHEGSYLRLMRLYALQGDRARSLRLYHTCATLLLREMGVEPNSKIQAIYAQLLTLDEADTADPPHIIDTASAGVATRLIGRQSEWSVLRTCWENLRQRPVHVVVLDGDAGIGKTRLAEELTHWTERQGFVTAWARAYAAAGGLAYAPISDWLRTPRLHDNRQRLGDAWLTELARLVPELLDQHPDLPAPQPFTESWQRQRFYAALAHGLLAGNQPLLLTLDDLQWCDDETLSWLHYFLRFAAQEGQQRYPRSRLLLVCTLRGDETNADHSTHELLLELRRSHQLTELMLEPLTEVETESLAEEVTGRSLQLDRAAQLFADTGGNPLYIVESVRAAKSVPTPLNPPEADLDVSLPPENVRALMRARLTRLSANAQEIVRLAAVIGRAFRYELLATASMHSDDELVQGLEELWKRRIIQDVGSDAYDFSHDRLRDVAYAELSRPRRRLLHRRVAEALQQQHSPSRDNLNGQIAVHYDRAGLGDAAVTHYLEAGELALATWTAEQAASYFTRALALAADADRRARSYYGLASARFLLGQRRAAFTAAEQALALLDAPDHTLRPRLLYLQADLYVADAEPEAAEAPVRAALAAAERIGDQATVCQSLSLLGQIHSHRGDFAAELELIGRALSIARATGNHWREARTQADLAFLHAQMGEFTKAIPLAQAALSHLETMTARGGAAFAWNILGRAYGGIGRFDQAFNAFEQCRQVAEEIGLQSMSMQIPNMLGWLHYQLGDYCRALTLDREGVDVALRAGAVTPEISARLNVCQDLLALEGAGAALQELQQIENRMAQGDFGFHSWRWRLRLLHIQGLCHLQGQDAGRVLTLAAEGAALAQRTSAHKYVALNHELAGAALAQLEQRTEAVHELEQAVHVANAIECLPVQWQALVRLAAVHHRLGDDQRASLCLMEAKTLVATIVDHLSDAGLRATFLSFSAARFAETSR